MFNQFTTGVILASWALSSLPTASAALSWSTCTKDEKGVQLCKQRIPRGARIAIAVCCFIVLLLLAALVIFICINRRKARKEEKEYDLEASQVDGPPAIIATEYDPHSGGLSRIYGNGPKTTDSRFPSPPEMTGPTLPAVAYPYESRFPEQTRTAPVSQTAFPDQPYPFAYSPRNGNFDPPKTAFVSSGFPRPILAGERLKDKLKERPPSVSSFTTTVTPPSPSYR